MNYTNLHEYFAILDFFKVFSYKNNKSLQQIIGLCY